MKNFILVISLFLILGMSLKANAEPTLFRIFSRTIDNSVFFENLADSLRPKIPLKYDVQAFEDEYLFPILDKSLGVMLFGLFSIFIIKKIPPTNIGVFQELTIIGLAVGISSNSLFDIMFENGSDQIWKYTFTLVDQDNNRTPGWCFAHFEPRFFTLDFEIDPCYLRVLNEMPMRLNQIHTDSQVTKMVKIPQTVNGQLRVGDIGDWFMGQTKVVAKGTVPRYDEIPSDIFVLPENLDNYFYDFLFDDNYNQIGFRDNSEDESDYCFYRFSREDYEELSEIIRSIQNHGINVEDFFDFVQSIKTKGEPYNHSSACNR